MIQLISIDLAAQEDLMIWDQLARSFSGPPNMSVRRALILGSGEYTERQLETIGEGVKRVNGALMTTHPDLETALREENRKVVSRLTDESIHTVGMLGSDRGLVVLEKGSIRLSKRLLSSLWQAPGIVAVLTSSGRNMDGNCCDMHPLVLAHAIKASLDADIQIVHLAQRLTSEVKEAEARSEPVSLSSIRSVATFFSSPQGGSFQPSFCLSHVQWLAEKRWVEVI